MMNTSRLERLVPSYLLIYQGNTAEITQTNTMFSVSRDLLQSSLSLNHDIRNLDVLLGLVFSSYFEDDISLVIRNWLLANVLHQITHPVIIVSKKFLWKLQGKLTSWEGDLLLCLGGRS